MLREEKERLVAELTDRLKSTETLIVADYRGLTVTDIDKLRTDLIGHGARFTVVKNTLTRRAAEAAGTTDLLALLEGPTAIAFLESEGDPVAVAKALNDAAKAEVLSIKGGVLEGTTMTAEAVKELASLPPVDTLRAQVAGAILSPLTTVVMLLSAPLHDLVGLIDARIRQLEERATVMSAEEPAEAPARRADAGVTRRRSGGARRGAAAEAPPSRPRRRRSPKSPPNQRKSRRRARVATDTAKVLDTLGKMTVLELVELKKAIEEEWGVTAAAPVAVAAAAAPARATAPPPRRRPSSTSSSRVRATRRSR